MAKRKKGFQLPINQRWLTIGASALAGITIIGVIGWFAWSQHQKGVCRDGTQDIITTSMREWDDNMELASSTSRISLAPVLASLQSTIRELENEEIPQCALLAKAAMIVAMRADISLLLDFASGDDVQFVPAHSWTIAGDEVKTIRNQGKSGHNFSSEETAYIVLSDLFLAKMEKSLEDTNAEVESDNSSNTNEIESSLTDLLQSIHLVKEQSILFEMANEKGYTVGTPIER